MALARVVDFETTGFEPPKAQVCEVGICDVITEDRKISPWVSWLCNVGEMPPEVRAIHHISKGECDPHAVFDQAEIYKEAPSVIVAHNADFECRFMTPPMPVICTYKSALRVWPDAPSHSNGALRYWLEDAGKISPDHALTMPSHRAGPDAYVTAHILCALLDAGATGKQMVAWTKEPRLLPTCPIGKFKGKPWAEVEAGFLGWMLRQDGMEADLKWNAQREIARRCEQGN